MSTSPLLPFLLLFLCAAAASPSMAARIPAAASEADETLPLLSESVHDILPQFGLPKGLLPSSVTSYSVSMNGDFVVELAAPCYVQFSDLVFYDRKIRGKLSYGSITNLSGIQVKKLFAWFSVTGIAVDKDGKAIEFQVGFLSQKLPYSMFANIPTCRNKPAGGATCHDREQGATVAIEVA